MIWKQAIFFFDAVSQRIEYRHQPSKCVYFVCSTQYYVIWISWQKSHAFSRKISKKISLHEFGIRLAEKPMNFFSPLSGPNCNRVMESAAIWKFGMSWHPTGPLKAKKLEHYFQNFPNFLIHRYIGIYALRTLMCLINVRVEKRKWNCVFSFVLRAGHAQIEMFYLCMSRSEDKWKHTIFLWPRVTLYCGRSLISISYQYRRFDFANWICEIKKREVCLFPKK